MSREQGQRSRALGGLHFPPHARLHGVRRDDVDAGQVPLLFSFFFPLLFHWSVTFASLSFVLPLVRFTSHWDKPGQRAKVELATSRHCADSREETDCTYLAMI